MGWWGRVWLEGSETAVDDLTAELIRRWRRRRCEGDVAYIRRRPWFPTAAGRPTRPGRGA